jgi:ADP-ribose pyrophosphatase
VIFDVYQWEQEMFDGSTETFEKLKRPDTVVVFPITEDGKIILTKQEQPGKEPFIGAAGGRVDPGEDILDAAKRELLEESGYKAAEFTLWKSMQPISKIEWAVYVFVARGLKKVAELNLDAGEKIELMPVSFDEFLKIAMEPNFYEEEINRDVVEAQLDPAKKVALREFMLEGKAV